MNMCTAPHFFGGRFAEALWLIQNLLFQFACVEKHGETITVEAERCCCVQRNATLTRRAIANSKPRRPKQPVDFAEGLRKVRAEAPRKRGPVFAGKCPRSSSPIIRAQAHTGCGETLTFLSPPILAEASLVKHNMPRGRFAEANIGFTRQGCGRVSGSFNNVPSSL